MSSDSKLLGRGEEKNWFDSFHISLLSPSLISLTDVRRREGASFLVNFIVSLPLLELIILRFSVSVNAVCVLIPGGWKEMVGMMEVLLRDVRWRVTRTGIITRKRLNYGKLVFSLWLSFCSMRSFVTVSLPVRLTPLVFTFWTDY